MSLNAQKYIYFFLKSKLMQISKIQYWELDVFRTSDFREFGNSYTWPTCFAVWILGTVVYLDAIFKCLSILGFHTISRDTKDNRHSGHVGVPNKRNNQNSFVKSTPTRPSGSQVKTDNIGFLLKSSVLFKNYLLIVASLVFHHTNLSVTTRGFLRYTKWFISQSI